MNYNHHKRKLSKRSFRRFLEGVTIRPGRVKDVRLDGFPRRYHHRNGRKVAGARQEIPSGGKSIASRLDSIPKINIHALPIADGQSNDSIVSAPVYGRAVISYARDFNPGRELKPEDLDQSDRYIVGVDLENGFLYALEKNNTKVKNKRVRFDLTSRDQSVRLPLSDVRLIEFRWR